ncbi:hypothetical protein ACHAPU_010972 [Fusarium lateritium]
MSGVQRIQASSAYEGSRSAEAEEILRESYNGLVAFQREAKETMARLKAETTVAEEASRLYAENKELKIGKLISEGKIAELEARIRWLEGA